MAWTAPKTWTSAEDVTHTELNTYIRDNQNETAPGIASAAGRLIVTDAANSVAERIPSADFVTAAQTTTSFSFTDLSTAGPAVTVTTGTKALVIVSCKMFNNTAGSASYMSWAISGATTASPLATFALIFESESTNHAIAASYIMLVEGLNAGSNTFTAKYAVNGNTGTFDNRRIAVIPF